MRNPFRHKHTTEGELTDAWSVTEHCKCGAVRFRSISEADGWSEWRNYFEEIDKILRKK